MTRSRTVRVLTGSLVLLAAILAHRWLEGSMLRHMLLQLPSLGVAGALLFGRAPCLDRAAAFDRHGLTVFTAALFVSAYWMVPRALELSITSGLAQTLKFATLCALGAALPGAIERANGIIQIFFMGNFCAMTAIVGMLYQEQSRQLCNSYFIDDQANTGIGLVVAACALALWWCVRSVTVGADPIRDSMPSAGVKPGSPVRPGVCGCAARSPPAP